MESVCSKLEALGLKWNSLVGLIGIGAASAVFGVAAAGLGCAMGELYFSYQQRRRRRGLAARKPPDLWNNSIFFPSLYPEEGRSLSRLLTYINSAERSLKVCVMTILFDPLLEALRDVARRGVRVQVFTSYLSAHGRDSGDGPWAGVTGRYLTSKRIPVRSMKKNAYSTIMHNKYVIIDDEAVFTGSMNWTQTSVTSQRENIMITTDERIVPKYVKHFDQLWAENDWDPNEN